jgi:hypothetical protein
MFDSATHEIHEQPSAFLNKDLAFLIKIFHINLPRLQLHEEEGDFSEIY